MRGEQCSGGRDPATTRLQCTNLSAHQTQPFWSSVSPSQPTVPSATRTHSSSVFTPPHQLPQARFIPRRTQHNYIVTGRSSSPILGRSMQRKMALEARMTAVRKGNHDIDIVQAVQGSRVLYDKSHEHHKNPRVKEVEWQRIGEELGVPAMAVIKRWTVIRERFASEKRKVQQLGPSSWWLMQHMDWLNAHIQPRQRGKFLPQELPTSPLHNLPNLPNLTHISNLPNLTCISNFNNANLTIQQRRFSNGNQQQHKNGNLPLRYLDVGEPEEHDDSRSNSPIMSIAYPEVCMKDISSEEEEGSFVSMKTENGSYKTPDDDNGSYTDSKSVTHGRGGSTDGEMRSRRGTHGSEDSTQGPLTLGLDLDEAAAARLMAALKGIDDPVLRHRFRQRAHHLAEECELAALQTLHQDKKIKTEI